ncbi:MAG: RluA family pseudouridine synthase [bacterium]|nr:RluA family pseudouridine synthase [bacterium]
MQGIAILYEDADVLVINKPAGLIVHGDGRTNEPTVVDWILHTHPEIKGVGENQETDRSGLVHRLDRETSGVMVVAKNQTAYEYLKKQFQSRNVEKIYHVFVYGSVKHDEGVIDRSIARSKRGGVLWSATRGKKGKEREAVTEYKVLKRLPSQEVGGDGYSLLELRPLTGRTHQLRVHLKAINYPVVCDKLYAPKRGCALGFARLALHARSLTLALLSGKPLKIQAPYPEDFERALRILS